MDVRACLGSQTPRSPDALTITGGRCCLRPLIKPRHSESSMFRRSIALPARTAPAHRRTGAALLHPPGARPSPGPGSSSYSCCCGAGGRRGTWPRGETAVGGLRDGARNGSGDGKESRGATGRPMCRGRFGWARRTAASRRGGRSCGQATGKTRRSKRRAPGSGSTGTPVRAGNGTPVGESVWPMRSSRRTYRR